MESKVEEIDLRRRGVVEVGRRSECVAGMMTKMLVWSKGDDDGWGSRRRR